MSQLSQSPNLSPATVAEQAERYLLGFFVSPAGERFYDRVHLVREAGTWRGDLVRLLSGRSERERFTLSAPANGHQLEILLDSDAGDHHQRLTLELDEAGAQTAHIATLEGTHKDAHPLPRLPYMIEEVPTVRLAPSPTHGWGVVALQAIATGEEVLSVRGPIGPGQTLYSFRCANGKHVEPTGYGHFVNHSCVPSCKIVYREDARPALVALRNLAQGDEITFDYTVTEGDLANAFECRCPADVHKV